MASQKYNWTPKDPILLLPEKIRSYYVQEAKFLIDDLTANKLKVVLVPAPEPKFQGRKIRVVESQNPEWYRELYLLHNYFRRDSSFRALERIVSQEDKPYRSGRYKYDFIYRALITKRLTKGYSVEGCEVPPNEEVKGFLEGILGE